jgi:hypothetical protein
MTIVVLAMCKLLAKVGNYKLQKLLMLKGMMMYTSLKCTWRICRNKVFFGSHIIELH